MQIHIHDIVAVQLEKFEREAHIFVQESPG